MTLELDPDIRLYAWLTLGRGWRRATILILWVTASLALASGYVLTPFTDPTAPGLSLILPALFVLLIAPARAVTRLFDLERGGLLDQTRLCGRRPIVTLAAVAAGSTTPYVLAAIVLIGAHLRSQPAVQPIVLALICFAGALAIGLFVYGTLPAAMAPDSRFGRALLIAVALTGGFGLRAVGWLDTDTIDSTEVWTLVTVLAALVPAGWLACRRIRRPSTGGGLGGSVLVADIVRRVLPRAGPPEFMRQLRCTILSGGTLATILAAPLAVVGIAAMTVDHAAGMRTAALNAMPFGVLFVGAIAASMTVRREIESRTLDFVRITPQTPERVAVSWYAAFALPFWTAALLAVGARELAAPGVAGTALPAILLALGVMLPAISIAEGFQRRSAGTYLALAFLAASPLLAFSQVMFIEMRGWGANVAAPWHLPGWTVVAIAVTAAAVGAAAGRIRRSAGPALVGLAAAAAAVFVAAVVRAVPVRSYVYPRLFVAAFALLGSFAATEDDAPSAPWRRVSAACAGAFLAVALFAAQAGLRVDESLTTGAAAALALGAGILLHELLWRIPLLSLAIRASIFIFVLRLPWIVYQLQLPPGEQWRAWVPPMIQVTDLAALAVVFIAIAIVHRGGRRT